jgi:hypothetical protein
LLFNFRIANHFSGLLFQCCDEEYKAQHDPIPAHDPIDFLNYAMETRGLTRATACHGLMKKSALNTGRGDTASHL